MKNNLEQNFFEIYDVICMDHERIQQRHKFKERLYKESLEKRG